MDSRPTGRECDRDDLIRLPETMCVASRGRLAHFAWGTAAPAVHEIPGKSIRPLESSGRGGSGPTRMGQTVLPENPALARRKVVLGQSPGRRGGPSNTRFGSDKVAVGEHEVLQSRGRVPGKSR